MALRVLLADESSTIKKVFQLALQDYAVEVRPVNIGVDVAMVAKGFKPDIIFADVMLQKKNGYDVCAELKQDAALKSIPFVLMWSGFVELDEDKFQASAANAQLEKPFDVAALRKLVSDLVPRTSSQSLSQYLTFPKGQVEAPAAPKADFVEEKPEGAGEDFTAVPIPKIKGKDSTEKYRLNMKPEELDPANIPVEFNDPGESQMIELSQISAEDERETDEFQVRDTKKPSAPPPLPKAAPVSNKPTAPPVMRAEEDDLELDEVSEFMPKKKIAEAEAKAAASVTVPAIPGGGLTAEQLEKIIREQSKDVIESVVWKVIPELATQIIERELNKLLKERDSHPY